MSHLTDPVALCSGLPQKLSDFQTGQRIGSQCCACWLLLGPFQYVLSSRLIETVVPRLSALGSVLILLSKGSFRQEIGPCKLWVSHDGHGTALWLWMPVLVPSSGTTCWMSQVSLCVFSLEWLAGHPCLVVGGILLIIWIKYHSKSNN